MKILEHLVTDPEADDSDCVRINVNQEELHCTPVAKGAGRDIAADKVNA